MLRSSARQVMTALPAYLSEAMGLEVRLEPCDDRSLPAYLTHTFVFACGEILDVECVFAILRPEEERQSPSVLEKHVARIAKAFELPVVLVTASLSSRDRKRLVARRLAFIAPFTQLYLPPLGIDFRDKTRPRGAVGDASKPPNVFKPVTQLVLLFALLHPTPGELHARELADALGVSLMSISRAFRDLEAAGLITRWQEGRRRPVRLSRARHEVWHDAQRLMASPVKARFLTFEREIPGALDAGVTALARISNLAPPRERTVAMSANAWQELRDELHPEPAAVGAADASQVVVEVWTYSPSVLSAGPSVDVLSLYLSLRAEHDERIEIALEEAMESLQW